MSVPTTATAAAAATATTAVVELPNLMNPAAHFDCQDGQIRPSLADRLSEDYKPANLSCMKLVAWEVQKIWKRTGAR